MPHHRNRCGSSAELKAKLTCALLFSLPVLAALLLLLLFLYLFYLRYQGVDLGYLRTPRPIRYQGVDLVFLRTPRPIQPDPRPFATAELGLKEELREMLPVLIYKESFSVKDTQCSVCLGDYNAEDKLQQIPACGHAFHMDCIDLWLSTHTTCPLCRISLLAIPLCENTSPATDISIEWGDGSPDVTGLSVNLTVGGEACPV